MTSDVAFAPLDPRGAVLGDEVYTVLGEAILDGRLAPGERLRDVELAENLGVSRTPVREALQRLERCGLVEVSANRWTRVSIPDASMLEATHEFIVYTMGNAIRMAVGRCSDDTLDQLLAGVDELIAASRADDRREMLRLSAQFFTMVTYATGNRMLEQILEECEFGLRRNLYGWRPHVTDEVERTDMYRVFRDAVAARDGDRAERILRLQHGFG
ncbi:GntR family transcriptional regulator [Microbacterium horticulturae]|uniref:GntR family transcriptional regulator n=1 Tax=Microbacterium horticulturae TaxID=3028316 RepID=A0ABY8BXR9_9MICO|nr:GntR family transcriptional regulator [Microbacterium sp. KACC 23027]WEG08994.1 GntR family transcriptional regulator [Microbacterium sp. KACC 23027]